MLKFLLQGALNRRLTRYLQDDLKYDKVPDSHLDFLNSIRDDAIMILVSYRYQSQFDFLSSLGELGLTSGNLFGPNNAFALGEPGTSSDGSRARFVGTMWQNEIRAQRRLRLKNGKTFPPLVIGDSIRDIHFAVDIGGIFFGVGDTGEHSKVSLLEELEKQKNKLNSRSRVFSSLADENLQCRLVGECQDYRTAVNALSS